MPAAIKVGGTWKTLTAIWVKVGGTWKQVTSGKIKVGGTWKEFFATGGGGGGGGSLSVSGASTISKTSSGSYGDPSGNVATSAYGGLTVTGATGAVTFSWARYSAPDPYSGGFIVSNGTTQTPSWRAVVNAEDSPHQEVWRVTATDSVGATGTFDVTVTLRWLDLL